MCEEGIRSEEKHLTQSRAIVSATLPWYQCEWEQVSFLLPNQMMGGMHEHDFGFYWKDQRTMIGMMREQKFYLLGFRSHDL